MISTDFQASTGSMPATIDYQRKDVLILPVAPRANARIRFMPEDVKMAKAIPPGEAARWLQKQIEEGSPVDTIGFVGPGDPLASADQTFQTLRLINEYYPTIHSYIRTIGIDGEKYADQLAQLGVKHIEILIDGVDPSILEKLYAWIRPGFKTLPLPQAVEILKAEQEKAIRAFKDAGMHVTAVTTLFPDYNLDHIDKLAKVLAKSGVDDMIIERFEVYETAEIPLEPVDNNTYKKICDGAAKYLPIIEQQEVQPPSTETVTSESSLYKPTKDKPNMAVVSSNGMDVDLHLGHAIKILIYGPREDGLVCMLGVREAPEPGGGQNRWLALADVLKDCFVLLAASAGEKPRNILSEHGLPVHITEQNIDGTVEIFYGLDKKKGKNKNN